MKRPERVLVILLLFAGVAACNDARKAEQTAGDRPPDEQFAGFARDVFAELRSEPLDTTLQTEIGLFGDMSVGADEQVVMRQYRYRLDSSEYGPVARMAFQVRDAEDLYAPVPVVLTFVPRDASWHLEEALFGDAVPSAAVSTSRREDDHQTEARQAARSQSPLHQSLRVRLDAWLDAALTRVGARNAK